MPLSTNPEDLANSVKELNNTLLSLSGTLDGWSRSGQQYPDFDFFRAERAEFVYPPLQEAEFQLNSTTGITTGVWNTLVFDTITQNPGIIDYSTASTGLFVFNRPSNQRIFLVSGYVTWSQEGGGLRSIKIESYPSTSEILIAQHNGDIIAQGFFMVYPVPEGSTGFGIMVSESVGWPIVNASMSLWEIGRT